MMKKFNFRLQKLLNLEDQREQQEKMKLQSLTNKLRGQEKILGFLKDSLLKNQTDLAGNRSESTNAQQLMLLHNYIVGLNERIEYQTKMINEAGAEVENCRNDLIEIQKDRKILEKIKEKDKEEYTLFIRKNEIKQFDDIFTGRQFAKENA